MRMRSRMGTPKIKSIQRCFEILSAFTKAGKPQLDTAQIGRLTQIPTSSLYRHLQTLTGQSALDYDPQSKKYSLGPLILKLGTIANDNLDIRAIAKPFMEKVRDEVQETVYLTGLFGKEAICIEKIDCKNAVRFFTERGDTFPIYASATGRVLMAYLTPEERENIIAKGLERYTQYTITDPVKLRKRLETVRERGFAFSNQELGLGGMAIAAPIFDSQCKIFAGLSIGAPVDRFKEKNLMKFSRRLIEYANQISALIGCDSELNRRIN